MAFPIYPHVQPSYKVVIAVKSHEAMAEIRRMAQSARRSIGQQARYHMEAMRRGK